ncbi:hypothetical protein F6Y05_34400 [Bacillus megaterium]|nr:hypothetical protein [Priestia megaterium]
MKNLSNHLKEKVQEHLKALQLEEIEWLDEQAVVESWKEQKVIAYGGAFSFNSPKNRGSSRVFLYVFARNSIL